MSSNTIKLSEYARRQGIGYRAAWNRFKAGKIPSAFTNDSGGIMVDVSTPEKTPFTVVYARVSSPERRQCLDGQVKRCTDFANAQGLSVDRVVKEIGSGLNDERQKLSEILSDDRVTTLVVEHKDRLTRFGFNYISTLLDRVGCKVLVVNTADTEKEDLMHDFISVITSFCARIYSRRKTKRQVERIIELSQKED